MRSAINCIGVLQSFTTSAGAEARLFGGPCSNLDVLLSYHSPLLTEGCEVLTKSFQTS